MGDGSVINIDQADTDSREVFKCFSEPGLPLTHSAMSHSAMSFVLLDCVDLLHIPLMQWRCPVSLET